MNGLGRPGQVLDRLEPEPVLGLRNVTISGSSSTNLFMRTVIEGVEQRRELSHLAPWGAGHRAPRMLHHYQSAAGRTDRNQVTLLSALNQAVASAGIKRTRTRSARSSAT